MGNEDRRRFFRIEDRIKLNLRRVSAGEAGGAAPTRRPVDVLSDIDRRMATIIAAARVQAPAVAELAELLNRKLDHLIETLQLGEELVQRAGFREHEVSLSACGIAFGNSEAFASGESVALEMLLPPDETRLRLVAQVVRCTPRDTGAYQLLLDFTGIGAEQQEFLIQYIVRRQSQILQQLREAREARGQPPGR